MIDEKFVAVLNSDVKDQDRKLTIDQVQELFDSMGNQRIGALFDFIKWIKRSLRA